mmetsp:Transcript_12704/g.21883  ORF Transcript_12704/g.21883 Transcript_12704/m.21883 type:complete len:195 (-) Transcript_12704:94-678(-)
MTDDEREAQRMEWAAKLQQIRDEYGSWNFRDDYPETNKRERPFVDWAGLAESKGDDDYNVHDGEISKEDFPKDAWQTDEAYVTNFLSGGKSWWNASKRQSTMSTVGSFDICRARFGRAPFLGLGALLLDSVTALRVDLQRRGEDAINKDSAGETIAGPLVMEGSEDAAFVFFFLDVFLESVSIPNDVLDCFVDD